MKIEIHSIHLTKTMVVENFGNGSFVMMVHDEGDMKSDSVGLGAHDSCSTFNSYNYLI